MDAQSARGIERTAKASLVFGVLALLILVISISFPGLVVDNEGDMVIYSIGSILTRYAGLVFGILGYMMAASAIKRIRYEGAEERVKRIVYFGRTLSIIGIVFSLLFFCARLNTGFAF